MQAPMKISRVREDADRTKYAAIENEEEFSDYEDEERRAKKGKPKKHSKRIYSPFLRSLITKNILQTTPAIKKQTQRVCCNMSKILFRNMAQNIPI